MDKNAVLSLLSDQLDVSVEQLDKLVGKPKDPSFGDITLPVFVLAKGANPVELAKELATKLESVAEFAKVNAVGPYINIFFNQAEQSQKILHSIIEQKEKYGIVEDKKSTAMIEFFHANTHKAVHIGHLRNICLGTAIANILEASGKNVLRVNYQGDIGPHVAKCIWAYQHSDEQPPDSKKGVWLGKLYAKGSTAAKEDEAIASEIKELNKKIYERDDSVLNDWQKTRQWCLDDFSDLYKNFGFSYDRLYFESEVDEDAKIVFNDLLEKNIAKRSDGAIIVDLEEYDLGVYVAITSEGYPTYNGKEYGLARLKLSEFDFDESVHVVGSEQEFFFKQMFKTYQLANLPIGNKSTHVSYGLVMLPEGKMSSRDGNVILFYDLYDKLYNLSIKEVESRHNDWEKKEIEQTAKDIAYAAMRFAMISKDPAKTIIFDWNAALDFQGETGPYLQYTHARICSILKKYNGTVSENASLDLLSTEEDRLIVSHLQSFSNAIDQSAKQYKTHILCRYLLDLAQLFNSYYAKNQIISEDKDLTDARIVLISSVKQVLQNGLSLLGIKAVERM